MEDRKSENVVHKVSPHFSFIYELFMPTGRKIKSTIVILFIMCIASILIINNTDNINSGDIVLFADMSIINLLSLICLIVDILLVLKLVFHIVFQAMQYKHISYTFYETHMVYEDDFLNQHRKNIEYSNIKEVEIRRTIIDRILGYGVIVIYTNAENKRNNGLVIYAIKNPKESYDIIDEIIHKNKELRSKTKEELKKDTIIENVKVQEDRKFNTDDDNDNEISDVKKEENNISAEEYSSYEERQKRLEESKREEEEFLNSLKNVNDEDMNEEV